MPTKDPEKKRAKEKRYRDRHPDIMRAIAKRYKDKDPKAFRARKMELYFLSRERSRQKTRELHKKWRSIILIHYGAFCKKCGIEDERVLVIDHVNGGGSKDRKEKGGPHNFYRWVIKNGFPRDYQILCHNCNWIKRMEKGEYQVAKFGITIK